MVCIWFMFDKMSSMMSSSIRFSPLKSKEVGGKKLLSLRVSAEWQCATTSKVHLNFFGIQLILTHIYCLLIRSVILLQLCAWYMLQLGIKKKSVTFTAVTCSYFKIPSQRENSQAWYHLHPAESVLLKTCGRQTKARCNLGERWGVRGEVMMYCAA